MCLDAHHHKIKTAAALVDEPNVCTFRCRKNKKKVGYLVEIIKEIREKKVFVTLS